MVIQNYNQFLKQHILIVNDLDQYQCNQENLLNINDFKFHKI